MGISNKIREFVGLEPKFESIFNVDKKRPKSANVGKTIDVPKSLTRVRQDLETWRSATIAAESIMYPNRTQLLRLYKDVDLDAHLTAVIDVRKNAILGAEFIVVDENGDTNEEKTIEINKEWFLKFTDLSLDSIYWGYSLIQMGDIVDNEFTTIELVPRHYVKQEFGLITQNLASNDGVSYLKPPYKDWYIGVGEKRDLGLYLKAAPHVIWKKGAMGSSSDFLETYGSPIRIIKTDVRDDETRTNAEKMLADMGANAWGVFDRDDELELHNGQTSSGNDKMFDTPIDRANSELSKLILGQTGTTDEKSFTGAANVHERVMQSVKDADIKFIESVYRKQLIPLLNKHGLGYEGLTIKIKEDDELTLKEKSEIDLKLLDHYKIPAEYFEQTYGVPVEEKPPVEGSAQDIQNKLKNLYGNDNT